MLVRLGENELGVFDLVGKTDFGGGVDVKVGRSLSLNLEGRSDIDEAAEIDEFVEYMQIKKGLPCDTESSDWDGDQVNLSRVERSLGAP